ncbi:MAG: hypothetical protein ABI904_01945 [Chloroflexota bacterium]
MKLRQLFYLSILLVVIMACTLPSSLTPTSPTETSAPPAMIAPTNTPIATGSTVTLNNVTFTIPQGLAKDALTEMVSAVTDPNGPTWGLAPAHSEFTLTSYQLQDKFHKPKLYVYPAQEYAALSEGAAESIKRLETGLANPNTQWASDALPFIPFFNAAQVFAAQIQIIKFQNGSGVRFLTEYAQSFATVNNHELFYHFQGVTDDGKYYIIVIMPITAPMLAADEKPDSPVPSDGVPFPGFNDPNPDFMGYYNAITEKLNATAPDSFAPNLSTLDNLVKSITITP